MTRILLLGGSREASTLARALAQHGANAVFSYAGRTSHPIPQPLTTRIGGFGGVDGLIRYLDRADITHIFDATHPFAAGMSRNAVLASEANGIPLLALERPAWQPQPGDCWRPVPNVAAAVADLPPQPSRIFLAIGRQNLAAFAERSEHHYLLRLVDPPAPDALPSFDSCKTVVNSGPFTAESDAQLMRNNEIDWVVSKNAGGAEAGAKIEAARVLGLPVTMIARPQMPQRQTVATISEALAWIGLPAVPDDDH